jgi:hypothetical protein
MDRLFDLKNEKNWKSLLLTDDSILLVNKSYSTADEFLEKFNEKGFLKQRLEISLFDIKEIRHPEKGGSAARINYLRKSKGINLDLIFASETEQQEFVNAVSKMKKMIAITGQISVLRAIGPALIGLAITALFTFIIYSDAEIIEMGGEVDTSGRRSLYKQLFAWLGEKLGTLGTLIAGGAIALLCIYFIYKNLQSRPLEVIYS